MIVGVNKILENLFNYSEHQFTAFRVVRAIHPKIQGKRGVL